LAVDRSWDVLSCRRTLDAGAVSVLPPSFGLVVGYLITIASVAIASVQALVSADRVDAIPALSSTCRGRS
jgi:hypothetical protein